MATRPSTALADVIATVRDYSIRHDLFVAGNIVLAAISGGVDSACLLASLVALRDDMRITVHAAHLDHGLRDAAEAAADRATVTQLTQRFEVPLTCGQCDVPALRQGEGRGQGDEAIARQARYEFLVRVARAIGHPEARIATGHTADDQAETVLLHLLRGSGPHGLRGMAPQRGQLVRPLLGITRAQTEAVCTALELPTRTDPTNNSFRYTRNRVRHTVLPLLRTINPQIDAALVRLAEFSAADTTYLEDQARQGLATAYRREPQGQEVSLDLASWAVLAPALRPHGLRLLLRELHGSADGFTAQHLGDILAFLDQAATNVTSQHSTVARASFPHRLTVAIQSGQAILAIRALDSTWGNVAHELATEPWSVQVLVPGEVILPLGRGRLCAEVLGPGTWTLANVRAGVPLSVVCDLSRVSAIDLIQTRTPLYVRSRRPGDSLRPLGLNGHRKVQDILVDAKIPRQQRNDVPLVIVNTGSSESGRVSSHPGRPAESIIWVAGLCLNDDVRIIPETGSAVRLTWIPPTYPGSNEFS